MKYEKLAYQKLRDAAKAFLEKKNRFKCLQQKNKGSKLMSKPYNMKLEIIQNLKKPKWGVTEK